MAIVGYITDKEKISPEDLSLTMKILDDFHCEHIYYESTVFSTQRPRLKYIMEEIRHDDTIVLHKLSNALSNAVELTNLCRLCRIKGIRLVSVHDRIDTASKLFKTTSNDILTLLATFSTESYGTKHKNKKLEEVLDTVKKIEERRIQDEKERNIVNMYISECSHEEIMKTLNIGSTRTLYKVLKKYGVQICRKKYNRKGLIDKPSEDEKQE